MHGNLSINVPECDVLCICGDITSLNVQFSDTLSREWMIKKFIPWLKELPVKQTLVVGGNHDFYLWRNCDEVKELLKDTNAEYLLDEPFMYVDSDDKQYIFYGSPWCHKFYDWAFMDYNDTQLKEKFMEMPDDVDVLLTHDAPYGVSDVILQKTMYSTNDHIGSKGMADAVAVKQPKIHLHGHLHSTNHDVEMLGDTKVYNVSVVDEMYRMKYKPLILEI